MNTRLEQFMRAENMNSAKLAEILQIQPSSISHLLSGRNKPSFDFISKLLSMFPELNPHWIINGKGEMYTPKTGHLSGNEEKVTKLNITSHKDDNSIGNQQVPLLADVNTFLGNVPQNTPINEQLAPNNDLGDLFENISVKTEPAPSPDLKSEPVANCDTHSELNTIGSLSNRSVQDNGVEKIVILYPDNTFEFFSKR